MNHADALCQYGTPIKIIDKIIDTLGLTEEDKKTKTFYNPCCGSGTIIRRLIEKGVDPSHIYGCEIEPRFAMFVKPLIGQNFQTKSVFAPEGVWSSKFDYVICVPPRGAANILPYSMSQDIIAKYGRDSLDETLDISFFFYYAAREALKDDGQLIIALPNQVYRLLSGKRLLRLIDDEKGLKKLVRLPNGLGEYLPLHKLILCIAPNRGTTVSDKLYHGAYAVGKS